MTQTVLITGATSGFGKAMAKRFVKEGWNVVGTGRRQERLDELKNELGDAFYSICFDIRDKQAVMDAVDALPESHKDVDVLVNNAGLSLGLETADKCSLDDWETMVDTNIKGVLYITAKLLPEFVKKQSGHVVNIGSVSGTYAYPGGNVYGGTKAFLNLFSLNLRADLVDKYVRVTSIEPGWCETEFGVVRFSGDKEKADNFYKGLNALSADDVAESVFWSVSLPKHVNINRLELMPTQQAFSMFAGHREEV